MYDFDLLYCIYFFFLFIAWSFVSSVIQYITCNHFTLNYMPINDKIQNASEYYNKILIPLDYFVNK